MLSGRNPFNMKLFRLPPLLDVEEDFLRPSTSVLILPPKIVS
jgi:hypothetical protein